jgi:hypothetical protein
MMDEKLTDYIRWKLGVSPSSQIGDQDVLHGVTIDLLIIERDEVFLIEIVSRCSIDTLARLNLARDMYIRGTGMTMKVTPVLVTNAISSTLLDMAESLGFTIIDVPKGMLPESRVSSGKKPVKISSEKSWQVVSKLIQLKTSSIKRLSEETLVSYGWAHATIEHLLRQNIVAREGDWVHVRDLDRLLTGIAWERSTMDLVTMEFPLGPGEAFGLAKDISDHLEHDHIPFAFACYLPGTLYTGYAERFDSLQLYLAPSNAEFLKNRFQAEGGKVKIQVLSPDRDLLATARRIENIQVTSPSQTLLDLAGLGFRAKDMTRMMVDRYADL